MRYLYFFLGILLLIIFLGEVLIYMVIGGAAVYVIGVLAYHILKTAQNRRPRNANDKIIISSDLLNGIETYETQFGRIVDEFGFNILNEDRFANIYNDYYFDKDNSDKANLIKTIISVGAVSDLAKCTKSRRMPFLIERHANIIAQQGYNKKEVEMMLFSIAKICGMQISSDGEIVIQNKKNRVIALLDKVKYLFYILPLIGLLCMFWVRIEYGCEVISLSQSQGFLFLVYLLSFVVSGIYFDQKRDNAFLGGYFCGVNIAGIILFLLSNWISGIVLDYLGIDHNYTLGKAPAEFPLLFIGVFILGSIGGLFISGSQTFHNSVINPKFLSGCFKSIGLCLLVGFAVFHIVPLIVETKSDIVSANLHDQRCDEVMNLSFMGVQLGSDLRQCMSNITDINPNYLIDYDDKLLPESISSEYKLDDGRSFIDSVINTGDKTWSIMFCVSKNEVIAIICEPHNYSVHTLIKLFTEKYGQPEHDRPHIKEHYFDNNPYEWNYKNCKIIIRNDGYSSYYRKITVSYIDNRYIQIVKDFNTNYEIEQERLQEEREIARQREELNRIKHKEQEELKQKKLQEQRDKKTLEQI